MNEHPNVVTVSRAFAAWNTGQIEILREIFSQDAVLRFAGNNPMSGTYRGVEEVVDALLRARRGGGTQADVESVLASDDHVMVFYHAAGEHAGRPYEEVTAMAMKVDADGKVTEVWFLTNEQAAHDAFWAALP